MKYFKHELRSRDNDKIFELIEAHGMQGYGIWWALLEELYKADSSGFQIEATETWFKRLSKQLCLTDWRTLIRTLDTMAEQGLIDGQLWAEHVIMAPGITERSDEYMRQKALATERKRQQREREKQAKEAEEAMSRVTTVGQVECHAGVTTNTDPDPDPNSSSNLNSKPILKSGSRVRDFEQSLPEPEPTVVAPAAYVSPPVTVARKEIVFKADPIADRFSAGGRLPDWRTGRGVNGLRQDFVEWLAKSYLAKLPCYKEQPAPSMADARSWIVSREKGNTELIEIQWLAFSDRGAQTVAKTSAAYDWSRDSRLSEWTALANSMNNYRFCYPDGVRDEERVAFYQWLEKQEVRSA